MLRRLSRRRCAHSRASALRCRDARNRHSCSRSERRWRSWSPPRTALPPSAAGRCWRRRGPAGRRRDGSHMRILRDDPLEVGQRSGEIAHGNGGNSHAGKKDRANQCGRRWLCRSTGGRESIFLPPSTDRRAPHSCRGGIVENVGLQLANAVAAGNALKDWRSRPASGTTSIRR